MYDRKSSSQPISFCSCFVRSFGMLAARTNYSRERSTQKNGTLDTNNKKKVGNMRMSTKRWSFSYCHSSFVCDLLQPCALIIRHALCAHNFLAERKTTEKRRQMSESTSSTTSTTIKMGKLSVFNEVIKDSLSSLSASIRRNVLMFIDPTSRSSKIN